MFHTISNSDCIQMSYINKKISKAHIMNKGFGFIANENITSGEILIIDIPLTLQSKCTHSDIFELLHEIFLSKQNNVINQFMKLCPKTFEECKDDYDKIMRELSKMKIHNLEIYEFFVNNFTDKEIIILCSKYMRNAFNYRNKPALLFTGTILNHSCLPNVIFGELNGKMVFKAITNISKGQEICDNYIDITLRKTERQIQLRDQYRFMCNCMRCCENNPIIIQTHNTQAIELEHERLKTFGFTKSKIINNK